jgi:single-strand DNA-binding protein
MAAFNRVILVGNVTRQPELRSVGNGTSVTSVGMAVNESYKKDGKTVESTVFVDVTFWGRTAEVAVEYLTPGMPILIEGKLKLDKWQDTDGKNHSRLTVTGDRMQMLGGKKDSVNQESTLPSENVETDSVETDNAVADNNTAIPF